MKKWSGLLYIIPGSAGLSFFLWSLVHWGHPIDYWWHFALWALGFLLVSFIVLGRGLYVTYAAWLICSFLWLHTIVFGDPGWFDLIIGATVPIYLLLTFFTGLVETIVKMLIRRKR